MRKGTSSVSRIVPDFALCSLQSPVLHPSLTIPPLL
jgi:hypothetical protein